MTPTRIKNTLCGALLAVCVGLITSQNVSAQESEWNKFLRRGTEHIEREQAARQALEAAEEKERLDSQKRRPQPLADGFNNSWRRQAAEPESAPVSVPTNRTSNYLVNTPSGLKQCRVISGFITCN